ncbi:MAG: ZIP family metal transporter [Betaproteobacteria bacterium]|nr:ZIP family metal transporter [Betaproteobacteria bacterium]
MSTLAWIICSTALGGVLSVAAAALIARYTDLVRVPVFISYAVGAMLGAVFLEILPHAIEVSVSVQALFGTVLGGILFFFLLEKLVLWRHHHESEWEHEHGSHAHHDHAQPRGAAMITIGDTIHNFVDGVLVAATFMADTDVGIVVALAIVAHEIPQELGDFLVLLHSGMSRGKALLLNLVSSFAMVIGGVLGYFTLGFLKGMIGPLLGFVAASMLYVAVADLIPGLHRRLEMRATVQQIMLIGLGVITVPLVRWVTGHT